MCLLPYIYSKHACHPCFFLFVVGGGDIEKTCVFFLFTPTILKWLKTSHMIRAYKLFGFYLVINVRALNKRTFAQIPLLFFLYTHILLCARIGRNTLKIATEKKP